MLLWNFLCSHGSSNVSWKIRTEWQLVFVLEFAVCADFNDKFFHCISRTKDSQKQKEDIEIYRIHLIIELEGRILRMGPIKVYACYNADKNVRLSSSSGAVFSSLAEYVLEQQGTVYGVAMSTDCYSAEFISVTSKDGLKKLRGSKYLQAKVGSTSKSVKKDLISMDYQSQTYTI